MRAPITESTTEPHHRQLELSRFGAFSDAPAGPATAGHDQASRASAGWPARLLALMLRIRLRLTAAAVLLVARRTRYLEPEMAGLAELVRSGSVCIDVGAAAGLYTVALARLAGPEGLVHSVEPVTFAHRGWARVLGVRSCRNVRRHVVALGADTGRAEMSVPVGRHGPVTGRSYLDWECAGPGSNAEFGGQLRVGVDVQTLDGLCVAAGLTRLDFIKIDVEGAEMRVLRGGTDAIDGFRPAMLIEIEDRHTARYRNSAEDVTAWLLDRGYTMHTWQQGWHEAHGVCPHTRNYLFLPPGWLGPARYRASAPQPVAAGRG
jgi:FkbM family methyltransferase